VKKKLRLSNLTLAAASTVVMGLGAYFALLWALAFAFYRLEGAGLRAQRTGVVGPSQPVPAPGAGARP
jgi:hypothetical protein